LIFFIFFYIFSLLATSSIKLNVNLNTLLKPGRFSFWCEDCFQCFKALKLTGSTKMAGWVHSADEPME